MDKLIPYRQRADTIAKRAAWAAKHSQRSTCNAPYALLHPRNPDADAEKERQKEVNEWWENSVFGKTTKFFVLGAICSALFIAAVVVGAVLGMTLMSAIASVFVGTPAWAAVIILLIIFRR